MTSIVGRTGGLRFSKSEIHSNGGLREPQPSNEGIDLESVTNEQLELFYSKSIQLRYFLLFMLIFPFGVFAQDSIPATRFQQSIDLLYGQKFFYNQVLSGSLNNLTEARINQPISYVGIQFTGILHVSSTICRKEREFPCSFSFYHVIPSPIVVNDSISGNISGFNLHLPYDGWDVFRRNKNIDLVIGGGVNTGRVRLFGDSRIEQVNAYFAPCVTIAPRFNIGKISLQFRVEYEFDITRSKWRKVWFSTSPKVDLGPMKSTGLSTSVSLGWVF